ncbi:RNA polymerase sigma factor [Labilibacter marinus]|uniref:RNA polymerase sigma factor n=1 Tax=Labilibacter marinus TaxID=1477105 RepID=UPI0009F9BE84|nr:RNA polymerase sigma factor [Labilibacter marinus]
MDQVKELDIINQILAGNMREFESLVNDYKERVINICYSYTNDIADAEDISQEVFIEVYKSLKKFNAKSSISTWIFRIASNKSLDHIRKQKRIKRGADLTSYISDFKNNEWSVGAAEDPSDILIQEQRKELLYYALSRLQSRQKEAYVLTQIEGLSQQVVGEIMNTSAKSIESLLLRAKKKLKSILEKQIKNYL